MSYSISTIRSAAELPSVSVLETRSTIDGAVMRARELSEKSSSVVVVWIQEPARRVVRVMAKRGVVRWARECTGKDSTFLHHACPICGGLGLIEDHPA